MQDERPRSVWPLSPGRRALSMVWLLPVATLGGVAAGIFTLLGWAKAS
jgi:hypothetical protein